MDLVVEQDSVVRVQIHTYNPKNQVRPILLQQQRLQMQMLFIQAMDFYLKTLAFPKYAKNMA
jgi:hypothetical protein